MVYILRCRILSLYIERVLLPPACGMEWSELAISEPPPKRPRWLWMAVIDCTRTFQKYYNLHNIISFLTLLKHNVGRTVGLSAALLRKSIHNWLQL